MSVELMDLRSDTMSRPTHAMLHAMMTADHGDDRFGESAATRALEEHCAALFGKQAALFMPTGTMSNQVALRVLAAGGREVLCEAGHHLNLVQAPSAAALAGVTINAVTTTDGLLRPEIAARALDDRARWTPDRPATGLVWTENTVSARGGRVYPLAVLTALRRWSRHHGLTVYLDGARIMHAVAATGTAPAVWGGTNDAMTLCFTKGLGAPMGAVLMGTEELIGAARRCRQWYGGGLHQSGPMAAAALWALRHNSARLAEDHANAVVFAGVLSESPHFCVDRPDTNIVHVDISRLACSPAEFVARAAESGVRLLARRRAEVRAVFDVRTPRHRAVRAAERLIAVAGELRPGRGTARTRWWDRIGPVHPVTISDQVYSRTWG
ncbi:threonine aldolase family protein [Actinoplanes sp. CA-252034]|uniref:threonine aldolase family protein n=1 Tax=Actinoplanes sp. CA-252034 TaxID=3239906 RepID=UPI003D9733F9